MPVGLMKKQVEAGLSIELKSLVESHDKPFVVIDSEFRVVAVNGAYAQIFGMTRESAVGQMCYKLSHGKDHPCSEDGEECPHEIVYASAEPSVCAHIHCDAGHRLHQVRVSAFPLKATNGELLMGECIEEIAAPEDRRTGAERMIGNSNEFLACLKQLGIAAGSDAPVLLQGETGTGKELAAEYIHGHSSRADKPFQIVDSTVLTESLFESEMFGHEKGSYTGSVGEKQGMFELAEGGTIFLDEIGDLPISQQAKLLRVLESGQFRRVGGVKTLECDVRIVCATNRHLWESVLAGRFREDLYYRIACLNIRLPNLRDRLSDIPGLARHLIEGINRSMRCSYHLIDDVYERLQQYHYPGNVRELRNILFIAATHSQNREIDAALVDDVINNQPHCSGMQNGAAAYADKTSVVTPDESSGQPVTTPAQQPSSLKDIEAYHIRELLQRYEGNRKMVAEALGVSERTMYRKLKKLALTRVDQV
jgi:transcriptional regulator with PAS, ATPase and Fis domain